MRLHFPWEQVKAPLVSERIEMLHNWGSTKTNSTFNQLPRHELTRRSNEDCISLSNIVFGVIYTLNYLLLAQDCREGSQQ